MGELVFLHEIKMKKGYKEMEAVKLCSNYDNDIAFVKKSVPVQQRNIRKKMTNSYIKLITTYINN